MQAASVGVLVHGLAGDLAAEALSMGILPIDPDDRIPFAIKKICASV